MDEELKVFTIITVTAIVFGAACGMYGCQQVEKTRQEAIKAGLVEESAEGGNIWTRPGNER